MYSAQDDRGLGFEAGPSLAKKLTPQDPDIDQAIRFVNSAQK